MPERRGPDREQLKRYVNRGMTQQQISDAWFEETGKKISRYGIAVAMKRYGVEPAHPYNRHSELIPWRVKEEHLKHYDVVMLRLEARRRKGLPLEPAWEGRLDSWLRQLEETNAVIYYEPETPQGFWHLKREPTDGDIIRRPKD